MTQVRSIGQLIYYQVTGPAQIGLGYLGCIFWTFDTSSYSYSIITIVSLSSSLFSSFIIITIGTCDLTICMAPCKDINVAFHVMLFDSWVEVLDECHQIGMHWLLLHSFNIYIFSCSTNTSAAASGSGCSSNHSRTTSVSHPLPHQPPSGDQWNDALYALQSVSQTV